MMYTKKRIRKMPPHIRPLARAANELEKSLNCYKRFIEQEEGISKIRKANIEKVRENLAWPAEYDDLFPETRIREEAPEGGE